MAEPIMAYPFAGYGVKGVFEPKSLDRVYSTALQNILTTPKGTVRWNPSFGSDLPKFVFDLNDEMNQQLIIYYAFRDIQESEPRLRVVGMDGDFDIDNYSVSFSVAFIANDDPTQTVRYADVGPIPLKRVA
jgi:phage baseplate assembly protein W